MFEDVAAGGQQQQGLVPQLFGGNFEGNPMPQQVRYRPRVAPRRSVVEIEKFAGEDRESIIEWLDSWNRATAANGWTPDEEQVMLPLYLLGRASQFYRNLSLQIKNDANLLKREIEGHFNSPSQRLQYRNLVGERYQKPNESVADFYEDICKLVQRGWSTKSPDFLREKSLEYFVKGLKPTIKKIFWGEEVEDIDTAYQKARTRELYIISKKGKGEVRAIDSKNAEEPRSTSNEFSELLEGMKTIMQDQKRIIALQLRNLQASPESGPKITGTGEENSQPSKSRKNNIQCWNCGKWGHFQNKCSQPRVPKNSEASHD